MNKRIKRFDDYLIELDCVDKNQALEYLDNINNIEDPLILKLCRVFYYYAIDDVASAKILEMDTCKKVILINKEDPIINYMKGYAYEKIGNQEQDIDLQQEYYEKAYEFFELASFQGVTEAAHEIFASRRKFKNVSNLLLEQALNLNPNNYLVMHDLAVWYAEHNDFSNYFKYIGNAAILGNTLAMAKYGEFVFAEGLLNFSRKERELAFLFYTKAITSNKVKQDNYNVFIKLMHRYMFGINLNYAPDLYYFINGEKLMLNMVKLLINTNYEIIAYNILGCLVADNNCTFSNRNYLKKLIYEKCLNEPYSEYKAKYIDAEFSEIDEELFNDLIKPKELKQILMDEYGIKCNNYDEW